jgi:hypothetical protein
MKKLFLLAVISVFMIQVQAQKLITKDVPAATTTAFAKANPAIQNAEWSKAGNDYEAQFTANNLATTVTYDASGKLLKTAEIISITELPTPATEYLKKNHKMEDVEKVSKITNENNVASYLVKVKGIELTFDLMGGFIK